MFLLVLLLPLALPQFPYELTGESIGEDMTRTSAIITMVCWAAGALTLGWLRLVRDDANR